jgi:TM2 domain-containing membrane protein YozV
MSDNKPEGASKKVPAGICGILLGALGVHKFILGYTTEGIIMLVVSIILGIFTCGVGAAVMGVIGLIEGILYLTKSDEDFVKIYVQNKKGWF